MLGLAKRWRIVTMGCYPTMCRKTVLKFIRSKQKSDWFCTGSVWHAQPYLLVGFGNDLVCKERARVMTVVLGHQIVAEKHVTTQVRLRQPMPPPSQ
eukprot:4843595-Amphidinium_carterae.2